jgi:hypothetical protein
VDFSSGGRNCVGQRLAIHQTTIGLAILVCDIKMNARPDYGVDLYHEGITMRRRHGMPMECAERCKVCKYKLYVLLRRELEGPRNTIISCHYRAEFRKVEEK